MFRTLALFMAKGKRSRVKGIKNPFCDLGVIPHAKTLNLLALTYNLLFTSRQFKSPNADFKRFTKLSSPLRNQTRGS